MGNIYSLIDAQKNNNKINYVLQQEIINLEDNVKKVEKMLQLLNIKCDKIVTKVVNIENKTYEIIDKIDLKSSTKHSYCTEWDYYDLNPSRLI